MDEHVFQWLADYVVMMEFYLGDLRQSRTPGLYERVVERIVEIRLFMKEHGKIISAPTRMADAARD